MLDKKMLYNIILEFDERKSKEAIFAHYCDKLEADIQSKLYDEEECIDLNDQNNNSTFNNPTVQKLLKEKKSFSYMWLKYGQIRYCYDKNFMSISNYVIRNNLHKLIENDN